MTWLDSNVMIVSATTCKNFVTLGMKKQSSVKWKTSSWLWKTSLNFMRNIQVQVAEYKNETTKKRIFIFLTLSILLSWKNGHSVGLTFFHNIHKSFFNIQKSTLDHISLRMKSVKEVYDLVFMVSFSYTDLCVWMLPLKCSEFIHNHELVFHFCELSIFPVAIWLV